MELDRQVLLSLLRFEENNDQESSFKKLNQSKPFEVHTDASNFVIRGILI